MGQRSRKKKEARQQIEREREGSLRQFREQIESIHEKYAKDWSEGHATTFAANGHYRWMAEFVKDRSLVLEVGTGDGASTLALYVNGSTVVSVECNTRCLELADRNLTHADVPVKREPRGILAVNDSNILEIRYEKVISSIPDRGVLLIGGNLLTDTELNSWLRQQQGFDAVVCWNIGASAVENTVADNVSEYRLRVQNKVYELADQVLKRGGILHIVDRGTEHLLGQVEDQLEAVFEGHRDQASITSLQVCPNIVTRPYTPPSSGSGVTMIALNTTKFSHAANTAAFWSIISTKQ